MSFPQLFKKSKLASYDPAVPQAYKTFGHYKSRGDWGIKRSLPRVSHSDMVVIGAIDTTEHQTIFHSVQAENKRDEWLTKDQKFKDEFGKNPVAQDYLRFLNLDYQSEKEPIKGLTYSHNNPGSNIIVQGRILNKSYYAIIAVGVSGLVTRLHNSKSMRLTQIDRNKLESFYVEKAEFDKKGIPRVILTRVPPLNIISNLSFSSDPSSSDLSSFLGSDRSSVNGRKYSPEDRQTQEQILVKLQEIIKEFEPTKVEMLLSEFKNDDDDDGII
ncbi:15803_t:CDS:2 [Entrophospora sp. SA101]|nr:6001_t:CDS:2 [Entrophospora sp. SA101]CAJ0846435.1 9673_t:CDS:2 [Entrophospora sp. SA101]CAJ0853119.1 15803_t:CDS:2 [Entrophospora sp. SA101]